MDGDGVCLCFGRFCGPAEALGGVLRVGGREKNGCFITAMQRSAAECVCRAGAAGVLS